LSQCFFQLEIDAMKNKFASLALIAAAGATLLSAGAYGQAMEVVTVEAVREIIVGKSAIGAPIKELSIRSRVSFADLDLATADGAAALQKRVEDTAKSTCKEIKVDVPAEGSSVEKCIKDALAGAQPQIDKAIAEAKAAKK
jgi:UrcA family protein